MRDLRASLVVLICQIIALGNDFAGPAVADDANGQPLSFLNEVLPILTKAGCNSGNCHGRAIGQNGFRLSLFGFDPAFDYAALVHEGSGHRVSPTAPEESLMLLKATG